MIMRKIRLILASFLFAVSVSSVGAGLVSSPAFAATPEESACLGSGGTWSGTTCSQGARTVAGTIKSVGNIIIFVTGAISVLMIIIGGLRYTTSNGDQGSITGAKNTILYAIIGLIVSVMAYAIINFILTNL
jgi:hypothetical protein